MTRPPVTAAVLGPLPALLLVAVLVGCSATEPPGGSPATTPPVTAPPVTKPPSTATVTPSTDPAPAPSPAPHPISVAALAASEVTGEGLRLGAVRERAAAYASHDVTWRVRTSGPVGSRTLSLSGVLNVPRGRGPFPAVVLAHGYIDPDVYERGQGMTRERGFLASRGFVALHVDYRNHAESGEDPRVDTAVRLGYSADVISAVEALVASREARVDPDRVALFGRSMGSGVVLKALAAEPGLVGAGVAWASVSSLDAENFAHFQADDPGRAAQRAALSRRHGLPDEAPAFWRGLSSRPHFGDLTELVLLVHGRRDEICPPAWARATQRALVRAGVDSTLEWYDDLHAFGPAFVPAMERTVAFLRRELP